MKDNMQDLQWLASEIENINSIPELDKIIQTAQGIPALLANDRKTKLMKFQQQAQGQQALAQGQKPPVMSQIKGQAAQDDAARQMQMMQQLAALQQPQDMGLAALPYDEEDQESPEYQSTEDEGAEEGEGAAMGGLVALAQGGSVDSPDMYGSIEGRKKGFADKRVDDLTGMLHDWYDHSVFNMAQGGPVRGFYQGTEDPLQPLSDFERRHPEVLDDTMGSRWRNTLDQHTQTDKDILGTDVLGSVADRWKAMHAGHMQTDKDIVNPIVDRWKAMHDRHMQNSADFTRGLKQTWEESTAPMGGPVDRTSMPASNYSALEEKGAFGPKPPGVLDRISNALTPHTPNPPPSGGPAVEEQGGAAQPSAPGWGAPEIASSEDPWSMGLRSLGSTPMRPDEASYAWNPDQQPVKSELERHAETEKASDQTRAPGARAVADKAPPSTTTAPQNPVTPPAGGQTVNAPGGQEQGQQRLTTELEQHPHSDEIVRTLDDPEISWEAKVKRLQDIMGAPYQMSPELLSKYEKQLADMRSEKGLMTGLSFLTGVLGARTPWMSQAISEGGLQALGTYGRYGEDEHRLQQAMLEQQMGNERAPIEARQKAGLELLKQEAEAGKQAAELKKYLAGTQLRNTGNLNVQQLRNIGGMNKAAYDRATKFGVEQMRQTHKGALTYDQALRAAQNTLNMNTQYFGQIEPEVQAQMVKDMARGYMQSGNAPASNQNMGNIGGTGQRVVIPNL